MAFTGRTPANGRSGETETPAGDAALGMVVLEGLIADQSKKMGGKFKHRDTCSSVRPKALTYQLMM